MNLVAAPERPWQLFPGAGVGGTPCVGRKEEALGSYPWGTLTPAYTEGDPGGTEASRPLPPASPDISPKLRLASPHPLGPAAVPAP